MTGLLSNPRALALLDSLWAIDTHIGVIRRRLTALLGDEVPTAKEIRDAAVRHQEKPRNKMPVVVAATAPDPPPRLFERTAHGPAADNPVRLVRPGTYPAKGFTMIGRGR